MTGVIHADQLDEEHDFVGTDRQAIVWNEPLPSKLYEWGREKIDELLDKWAQQRARDNERELFRSSFTGDTLAVSDRIERLQLRERHEARKIIAMLAEMPNLTDTPKRAYELVDLILHAFEDSSFFSLLKAIRRQPAQDQQEILRLVQELDVYETIKLADVVRAHLGVIDTFKAMLDTDVREKPDLQDFLMKHPWLIHPEWQIVHHEKRLESLLIDHFGLDPESSTEDERRVDFFCVSAGGRNLVIEVKRPSKTLGQAEIQQAIDYVLFLRRRVPTIGHPPRPQYFEGILVGHHLSPDGEFYRNEIAAKAGVSVQTWEELLDTAERIHSDFREALGARLPDHPRVSRALDES